MQIQRLGPKAGERVWFPDKPRDSKLVPGAASIAAEQCCLGSAPWPLVLLGEAGWGKTCVGLLMADRWGGYYTTALGYAERVASAWLGQLWSGPSHARWKVSRDEVRREWSGANLAVMDELAEGGRPKDHELREVKRAMDRREGKPTVYVSNLSLTAIAGLYGNPVASRLDAGTKVTLSGDRRGRAE